MGRLGTRQGPLQHHREHRQVGQVGHGIHEGKLLDELVGAPLLTHVRNDGRATLHDSLAIADRQDVDVCPQLPRTQLGGQLAFDLDHLAGDCALVGGDVFGRQVVTQRAADHRLSGHVGVLGCHAAHVADEEVAVVDGHVEARVLKDGLVGEQTVELAPGPVVVVCAAMRVPALTRPWCT